LATKSQGNTSRNGCGQECPRHTNCFFPDNLSAGSESNPQRNFRGVFPVLRGKKSGIRFVDRFLEEFMDVGKSNGTALAIDAQVNGLSAQQVVKAAHDELLQLMRQRAEIMKRIGTVKQTIAGLANLFGEQVLSDDLLELIDRKPNGRQPGFTKACRRVLMEVRRPLGARDVCVELERYAPAILARHKDPLASVTTVLNRLVDYGEARSLSNDRGRRVWEWISDAETAEALASRRTA
jgi:hypothetical protein